MNVRRLFVSPPFKACPSCGRPEEGVLEVRGDSFTRECLSCANTRTIALPPVQKTVVYLDQFVVGRLAMLDDEELRDHQVLKADPFWHGFGRDLRRAVQLQAIACPSSGHHFIESIPSTKPTYDALRDVYERLSAGCSFPSHRELVEGQASALLDALLHKRSPLYAERQSIIDGSLTGWCPNTRISVRFDLGQEWGDGLHREMEAAGDAWERISKRWQRSGKSFDRVQLEEACAYGPCVLQACHRWHERLRDPGSITPAEVLSPPDAAILVSCLLFALEASGVPEAQRMPTLRSFLESDAFTHLPFIEIRSALLAALAVRFVRGRQQAPSRGTFTDIDMISTLLPHCDAMFLDKEMASLLRVPEVAPFIENYPVTVLSLHDRNAASTYLSDLISQVPAEQARLAADAYGEA